MPTVPEPARATAASYARPVWDIFCRVIDNYGDLGVCWRLACNLAQRGQQVRLWADDTRALGWMAPAGHPHVRVGHWLAGTALPALGYVLVEAFGCQIAPETIALLAHQTRAREQKGIKKPVWINLEYLSAEPYVQRSHGLPSPRPHGLTAHFFYPGFTPQTGGLLREPGLAARQASFERTAWLAAQGVAWQGERLVSLFCYEPPALAALLAQLTASPEPVRLLVTAGRATAAVKTAFSSQIGTKPNSSGLGALSISYLPSLSQTDFDHLLWACDLNFVRGEDSLVRALWAGKPFIWQLYPQADQAHHAKLAAFMDWLQAPVSCGRFTRCWNGVDAAPLPEVDLPAWTAAWPGLLARLSQDGGPPDLAGELIRFAQEHG